MKISYMYGVALGLALLGNGTSVCMFRKQIAKVEKRAVKNVAKATDSLMTRKQKDAAALTNSQTLPQGDVFLTPDIRKHHIYPSIDVKDVLNMSSTSKKMRDLVQYENPQQLPLNSFYRLSPYFHCYHAPESYMGSIQFTSPAVAGSRCYITEYVNDPVVWSQMHDRDGRWLQTYRSYRYGR